MGKRQDDGNLNRSRRMVDKQCHRVEVIKRPSLVLVSEAHVDRPARPTDLHIRRHDRLAAVDRPAHRLTEHRVNAGAPVLHLAPHANDGRLNVGHGGVGEFARETLTQTLADCATDFL